MAKTEITGILEQNGYLWLICLTQGQNISLGIEDFEGKLVKVTRTQDKIIIEVIAETEPIPWSQFHKEKELCTVGGYNV